MKQLDMFAPQEVTAQGVRWSLYVDGASRNNPGPAGAGVVLLQEQTPKVSAGYFLGSKTNNQAEYLGLLIGLWYAKGQMDKNDELLIYSDSELMVRQLLGKYKVRNPGLLPLFTCAQAWLQTIPYQITHILRELNTEADKRANEGIDKKIHVPRTCIVELQRLGITL